MKPLLSLTMIVRNEQQSIAKTLGSVLPHVDRYTILDTGSTDGTQAAIGELGVRHNKPGRVFEEPFVDFAASRNRALELAAGEAVFHLSLDANDELRNGEALVRWCEQYHERSAAEYHAFLMRVQWNYEVFAMHRLFRSDADCRYTGVVHEHLQTQVPTSLLVEHAYVYHERELDEGKSRTRWERDCRLLEQALQRDPEDFRNLFYLAQSYVCCARYADGFKHYDQRAELGRVRGEADEETFIAMYRRAELAERFLDLPWSEVEQLYRTAHEYCPERAEPLVRIGRYYARGHDYPVAYGVLKQACDLPIPHQARMNVDLELYDYGRWDLLGSVAYHVGEFEVGEAAVATALRFPGLTPAVQRQLEMNLQVYRTGPSR